MITVYTTQTCANCKMVKKYLSAKNVEYREVDVSEDGETRANLLNITGFSAVPVVMRGDDYVVGFQPSLLAKLTS